MARNKISSPASDTWNKGVYLSLRTLMHLIAATHYWYAIYYDYFHVKIPRANNHRMGNDFSGKFKYLTFLDAIIQAIYFTICIVNDIIGSNEIAPKEMPKMRKLKDHILAALAFPLAMNVGIVFWGLMMVDRELIFPKMLDAFFPGWLNHIMHTNIMVFIILEIFISFRMYPKRSSGLRTLTVFLLCYLIWIHIIRYFTGIWVYPVLEVLDLPQRIIFFIGNLVFAVLLYLIGEFLNNKIWARELKQISKKTKH